MHYIRFLKLPKVTAPKTSHKSATCEVSAKITITNDLGELFLTTALLLKCMLRIHGGPDMQAHTLEINWIAHSRALDIKFPVLYKYLRDKAGKALECDLLVYPVEVKLKLATAAAVGGERIVSVLSEKFGLDGVGAGNATVKRELREGPQTLTIREEKGESIAKHIWDAGLVLSEHLSMMLYGSKGIAKQLPRSCEALRRNGLRAIELGTGVGLVGLKLADVLKAESSDSGKAKVLLTDLEDAEEIVEMNLEARDAGAADVDVGFLELDWTADLPEEVANEHWDIVLIADCTYNPDYAQALVNTIKSIVQRSTGESSERETTVLLAMKPRHAAENIFFEYMDEAGMSISEELKIPVPVLGGEEQQIRIIGFALETSRFPVGDEDHVAKKRRTEDYVIRPTFKDQKPNGV